MITSNYDTAREVTILCPCCNGRFTHARNTMSNNGRVAWEIYECRDPNCKALILVEYPWSGSSRIIDGRIVYPYSIAPTLEGVPEKVMFNYDQAVRSFSASANNAATVMARASIEAITQDKQAQGSNLKEKLKWLENERIISPMLWEWADTIRMWGNDTVHELDPIDDDTAKYIIEFTWELIEHIYVRPSLFDNIRREPT